MKKLFIKTLCYRMHRIETELEHLQQCKVFPSEADARLHSEIIKQKHLLLGEIDSILDRYLETHP